MKIKKAILTGGGRGSRLHPVTTTINKHLLPLANKPMIFHAIEKAVEAGITQIFINLNPGDTELEAAIGDGGHWGVKIKYFEQVGGPKGIAHVVHQAKKFIGNDPFLFYLSDNVVLGSLKEFVEQFHKEKRDCMLALSVVDNPKQFGVPVFNDKNELVDVWEKPQNPPNNYAVTGIYLYGPKVFFESYENIEPSARGEYEISDIHSDFIKRGLSVGTKEITGWWKDTGKPKDLLIANKLLLDEMEPHAFARQADIAEDAQMTGDVHIGIGSTIGAGVTLEGPVIIGENCHIENATIGPHVTIGSGSTIKQAKLVHSIILEHAEVNVPITIVDSLIGKKAQLVENKHPEETAHTMVLGDKTRIEL